MKNLKALRTELGISQQKLADEFNISQQSIYKYEHSLAEPDINTLMQIADYFNTTVDYIIGHDTSNVVNTESTLSRQELRHLVLYRKLANVQKTKLDALLESFLTEKKEPDDETS